MSCEIYRTRSGGKALVYEVPEEARECAEAHYIGFVLEDGYCRVGLWNEAGVCYSDHDDNLDRLWPEPMTFWFSRNLESGRLLCWNYPPILGPDHRVWSQEVEVEHV